MINIEDFLKINITLGEILSAEKVEGSDKLLKLKVDFGFLPKQNESEVSEENKKNEEEGVEVGGAERDIRQIVSGISKHYENTESLVGKKCFFVTNLEHREIKGLISEGMICAVSDDKGNFSLLVPEKDLLNGLRVK